MTMERHKRDQEEAASRGEVGEDGEEKGSRSRDGHASDSASDVEDLPDRFDQEGRSLDPDSPGNRSRPQWTTRSGEFERRPQKQGDWDVHGSWQVGGTDAEAVERLVKDVTGALEGKGGWMGAVATILGSGLLAPPIGHQVEDGRAGDAGGRREERENRGRHRRR